MSLPLHTTPHSPARDPRPGATTPLAVVLGMGATGLSCARHLRARGYRVLALDSRAQPPALAALREAVPDAELVTGRLDIDLPGPTELVVVSPGLALDLPVLAAARARDIPVTGDVELFARVVQRPVAAVTGSNGKSTVTVMLAGMAAAAGREVLAGGNLGTPALDLLAPPEPDLYVLELSSFQLERTDSLAAAAAVVLNVSPDHMDRHGDLDAYARAKGRIYRGATVAVVNRDDRLARSLVPAGIRTLSFGLGPAADGGMGMIRRDGEDWLAEGEHPLMPVDRLVVPGRHNVANALAALAMGRALGLDEAAMLKALREFRGLPHRTRVVRQLGGITWIDDSKATNVGAAVAAIEGLPGPLVFIGGGDGKGADFAPLAEALAGKARAAVLIGRDAARLAEALRDVCPVELATGMAEAVHAASRLGQAGDTVLLSPACASLDMFSSYVERGEVFSRAVEGLSP